MKHDRHRMQNTFYNLLDRRGPGTPASVPMRSEKRGGKMRRTFWGAAVATLLGNAVLMAPPASAAMSGKKFTILVITDLATVCSDTSGQGSVDGVNMRGAGICDS